ncbi:MAG: radical SAM protein [Proteobacteria bacterium]|nr:radical SAM domain-containing protein [Desulfobacula sp.]MBU3951359.1 radical SAM protein [Pseudomonadota bacterium]MBU4132999.1 radical SAM protein [Pseudomonadota bacterium]
MDKTGPANYPAHRYTDDRIDVQLNCRGAREYAKMSFPVKYGLFSRLETREMIFEFNLNQEIRHAKAKPPGWSHPSEWLKRTMGNDWVYYSTGGYAGVVESIGEYYLPNLMYQTNSLLGGKPFDTPEVLGILDEWHPVLSKIDTRTPGMPEAISHWLEQVKQVSPETLAQKAKDLFDISGARSMVLPPDARHSDYDIIPLTLQDGCLYKCRFCKVKNKKPFVQRSRQNIKDQILALKSLYGKDIVNYNSLFLGEHDGLNAPMDLILYAAQTAHEHFGFHNAYMQRPMLYFFGSVDALLGADDRLFENLNGLPFHTCINIGLESADDKTLSLIGKPITARQVERAFDRIQAINQRYRQIEMTCNFVMDRDLPASHNASMLDLVRGKMGHTSPKGSVYLSPLQFGNPSREVLFDFYHLKTQSRLPMFLYIIQRL